MRVIVRNKDLIIADRIKRADTFQKRLVGLLGKKNLKPGEGLLLEPCRIIHTFFLKFPLSVLFLSKQNKIVKVIPFLAPNRISTFVPKSAKVIELKANPEIMKELEIGDEILLVNK